MITRIVMLMLIAVLALPIGTLPRPEDTSHSPWGTVDAKGKKHKHHKKPKSRTVRETVTQTFTSTGPITIPEEGQANPYPSAIAVSGFTKGKITDVNLSLDAFTHAYPTDVDVLLSTTDGRQALVLSDVVDGDDADAVDVDLTLDDEAAAALPGTGALSSGTFRPTNFAYLPDFPDTFDAPAPTPDGNVALSAFDGADPNGTWRLWVMDNSGGDAGSIGGWALEITAEVDKKVKAKKHKKGKGRH
jgi:hypothetical protein